MTAPSITVRVLETKPIDWHSLEFIQQDDFKELPAAARHKLKASLLEAGFTQPLYVWEENGTGRRYCLDGRHRRLLLEELIADGVEVPALLPATFIDCADRQDAARRVLQFSSSYARITERGLVDFLTLNDLTLADVAGQIDLPHLDFANLLPADTDPAALGAPPARSLAERFLVPPFSVLDTRQGYWQDRKNSWLALGLRSFEGRSDALTYADSSKPPSFYELRNEMRTVAGGVDPSWAEVNAEAERRGMMSAAIGGTSIFDPVLAELMYRWFCPAGGRVLDPFAGGSVRGVVAHGVGLPYTGIDLRPEQVEANVAQWATLGRTGDTAPPLWLVGDSRNLPDVLVPFAGETFDFVFSCPPYADLEVYSDDPADLSTMGYAAFLDAYREIITKAVAQLADNRFAAFVVGEVRDPKTGFYRSFVPDTIAAFEAAGARYYNEIILITQAGSLPIRAGKQFANSRKVGKTHQNVLVFFKGDPTTIRAQLGDVEVPAMENDDGAEARPLGDT